MKRNTRLRNTALERLVDRDGVSVEISRGSRMSRVFRVVRRVDGRVIPLTDGIKDTIDVARAALKDTQQLVRHVDGRLGPLLDGVSDTSKVARATLVQTQQTFDKDVTVMLQEITSSARALRLLADYLERNPNALLYGKGADRR